MLSQAIRHGLVYTLGAILSRGISFFLLPLYAHALSPYGYGLVDYLTVVGAFVLVTLALEVSQALSRFLPERRADSAGMRRLSSTALWFTLAVHLVFLAAVTLAQEPIAGLLFDGDPVAAATLPWAAAAYLANALVNLARNQLRFELRPGASIAVAAIHAASVLALTAVLLLTVERPEPARAFAALIGGGAIAACAGGILARRALALRIDTRDLRMMLAFSAPLVLSSVGVILSQLVDRLIITELLGLEALAPYALAFRVALVVTLVMVGFQGAVTPLVYTHYREAESPAQIATLMRWFTGLALLLFAGLTMTDHWIVMLIAPAAYSGAEAFVPVLVLSTIVAGMYIFMPGMGLKRRTWLIAGVNLAGGGVNLALNLLLIPRIGLMGAAVATLCGSAVAFIGYAVISQRLYPAPHGWIRLGSTAALCIAAVLALDRAADGPLMDVLTAVGAVGVTAIAVVAGGLVRIDEIRGGLRLILRSRSPAA